MWNVSYILDSELISTVWLEDDYDFIDLHIHLYDTFRHCNAINHDAYEFIHMFFGRVPLIQFFLGILLRHQVVRLIYISIGSFTTRRKNILLHQKKHSNCFMEQINNFKRSVAKKSRDSWTLNYKSERYSGMYFDCGSLVFRDFYGISTQNVRPSIESTSNARI